MLKLTKTLLAKLFKSDNWGLDEDVEVSHAKKPQVVIHACNGCKDADGKLAFADFVKNMDGYLTTVATEDVKFHVSDALVPFSVSRHPDCKESVHSPHVRVAYQVYDSSNRRHQVVGIYWRKETADNHVTRNKSYRVLRIHVVQLEGRWRQYSVAPIYMDDKDPLESSPSRKKT